MSMDIGTSDVDTGTSAQAADRAPNLVLLELRKARDWGRPRLAKELHNFCRVQGWSSPGEQNIAKQIYRLESGRIRSPDDFYSRLYCEFFGKSPHDLFGEISSRAPSESTYKLRSHKFIPAYVGPDAVELLRENLEFRSTSASWFDCQVTPVDSRGDVCSLYFWPFGVAMYHLVEELQPGSVAEISVWRSQSYRADIEWAHDQLRTLTKRDLSNDPYVLGAYWVESAPFDGAHLDTAMRLLCIPRALIERDDDRDPSQAHAELVERNLLRDGFDHPGIVDFGIKGISIAFASWSGVVYHCLAPERGISENELVTCELSVQAIWSYCDYIRGQVELGRDPVFPENFGWRFLRGVRSRLTTERPQETSQHRAMRDSIVETSGLSRHLAHAVEALKETDGRS